MKRLLTALLFGTALVAWADHGPTEPPLSAEDKARFSKTLAEALRDKDITQYTYPFNLGAVSKLAAPDFKR